MWIPQRIARTRLSRIISPASSTVPTCDTVVRVTSPYHSSYERGCQEKKILPAPQEDARVVTCIQPHLILRGVIGLAVLDRRVFQRRCQPQLLVPTRRFHEAVTLDAIRFRSYAS